MNKYKINQDKKDPCFVSYDDISKCIIYKDVYDFKSRLLVFGDIHGDYLVALKMLTLAKVIKIKDNKIYDFKYQEHIQDTEQKYNFFYMNVYRYIEWIGEDAIVVQVGDQVDRCRPYDNNKCDKPYTTYKDEASDELILMMFSYLHVLARRKGGRVISLLGNHEIMNVLGETGYVSYKGAYEYAPAETREYNKYEEGLRKRAQKFSPKGAIGKFLGCTRYSSVIIGDFLFIHAGFIDSLLEELKTNKEDYKDNRKTLTSVNNIIQKWLIDLQLEEEERKVVAELTGLDGYQKLSKHSFFWNRVLGVLPPNLKVDDPTCIRHVLNVLQMFRISGILVGHSCQSFINNSDINSTCGETVWRVDNASSNAFHLFDIDGKYKNSRAVQVLEITRDKKKKKYNYKVLK